MKNQVQEKDVHTVLFQSVQYESEGSVSICHHIPAIHARSLGSLYAALPQYYYYYYFLNHYYCFKSKEVFPCPCAYLFLPP